ncbi:sodium:calcium antiporter [Lentisalinibacter salinarum]|uniref:sodium:calcium antiporter n=1 Tax=Lentisalinibacter salinarum TaxID=2992239 RepID=UPI0038694BE5
MDFLLLILGLAGLVLGTELTVGGALAIARRYGLPEFIVGLLVLSVGSDLPELAVAIDAGIRNLLSGEAAGVVVGSAVGSSVAQISFVLGTAGVLTYLTLPRRYVYRHGGMLLGTTALLGLFALDGLVSRVEGAALVVVYVMYVVALLAREQVGDSLEEFGAAGSGVAAWMRLAAGLLVVALASELTVRSVVGIAETFGLQETLISALVIGLGTSLPELAISVNAVLRKSVSLSVGNILGSNIFDTLVPIGTAGLIAPLAFDRGVLTFDLPWLFGLTALVLVLFLVRRRGLQRLDGALLLGLYAGYVTLKLTA